MLAIAIAAYFMVCGILGRKMEDPAWIIGLVFAVVGIICRVSALRLLKI